MPTSRLTPPAALLSGLLLSIALPSPGALADKPLRLDSGIQVEVRGEGRPILMIPGLNSAASTWDETCDAMRQSGFQCHLIQLPGFTGSPPVATDTFLADMRDGLLAYIESADLETPVVMGHSLGGFLALSMALEGGDGRHAPGPLIIVDGLPFLSAVYMPGSTAESALPMAEATRQRMKASDDEAYAQQTRLAVAPMTLDPERVDTLVEWGMISDRATSAQALYELMTTDLRDRLDAIAQPTLVLGSWAAYTAFGATRDSITDQFNAQFAQLPRYELVLSDEGRHFLMWDDREWLLDQVLNFLN